MNKLTSITRFTMLFTLLIFCITLMRADHCDEARAAANPSENRLAGVQIHSESVANATDHLGKPTEVVTHTDESFPPGSGEREYLWQYRNCRIVVFTMFGMSEASIEQEQICSIKLSRESGSSNLQDHIFTTSHGIGLGASRERIIEIYGNKFLEEVIKGLQNISFCWDDDTWLSFEFDSSGRVAQIHLLASVE